MALFVAVPAMAQHHGPRHFHHHHKHGHSYNWVAPLIVGGVVTYALTRPQPVIVEQPVIVQKETVCTAWREVQHQDGTVIRERTCYTQ